MALERIGDLPINPPDTYADEREPEPARIKPGELRPSERVLFDAKTFRVRTWERADGEIAVILEVRTTRDGGYDDPCHYQWTQFDPVEEAELLALLEAGKRALGSNT